MSKLRVCVIFGGRSGEHEISLRSARSVLAALDPAQYDVLPAGIAHDGRWFASAGVLETFEHNNTQGLYPVTFPSQPGRRALIPLSAEGQGDDLSLDLAYPVLHGTYGEDGTIQGLFGRWPTRSTTEPTGTGLATTRPGSRWGGSRTGQDSATTFCGSATTRR